MGDTRYISQLSIISFGPVHCCNALCEDLTKLGYTTNINTADDWINAKFTQGAKFIALFFDQETNSCQDRMELIRATVPWPLLGIFHERSPAFKNGSHSWFTDFLVWPCDLRELALRLARVGSLLDEKGENSADSEMLDEFLCLGLVGQSYAFRTALKLIKSIAPFLAPIIIQGETGTGKELAARAIHYLGPRRNKPFIPINCGAIPDNLFENELFGHEPGAFTDARQAQIGLVAQAEGGTLF